ncbi:MAG TPA: DUF6665 family protein [Rhizomicrobium sp.]|nr:DUF6665 family protein [Rhizomicrobium sp.]
MSFRPPANLSNSLAILSGGQSLHQQVLAEQAASLGDAGRRVEGALARLKEFDAGKRRRRAREDLVMEASAAVWKFFVQREILGLRDEKAIVEHYGIPREVLARLGQQTKKR